MRRRRRSPVTTIVTLVIVAIIGVLIHHRVSIQVVIEGALLVALWGGALLFSWRRSVAERKLAQVRSPPRGIESHIPSGVPGEPESDQTG